MLTAELITLRSRLRRYYAAAFERLARLSRRLVPPGSPLAPFKRNLAARLRPINRRRLDALLEAFVRLHPRAVFVQIGSNDGEQQDPLSEAIRSGHWSGVMVEPVPYVFERLQRNYGRYDRIRLENLAVAAENGTARFYHLPQTERRADSALPEWYDALGSFSREIVLSHKPFIPDIEERIRAVDVPTVTFETLCARNGIERLDLVHIDTEGHDFEILKQIDFTRWRPRLVIYEHHHLGAARAAAEEFLRARGYELMSEALDTWALHIADCAREDRTLLGVWRKLQREASGGRGGEVVVRGVDPVFAPLFDFDAEERRRLSAAYDDRGPVPPGASVYLSPNSPRLAEIRRRYAALDLPVSMRSQWHRERVEQHIDLLHFRGDNPYVWHYRELPRATRLKFYVYQEYLAKRDAAGLFGKLAEDGAFGCWTHEYEGRPRVSRDLLDSVNELNFLERELGVLAQKGLRVLDIGAGYGRLAHRLCTAASGVADYCCVDAVAESSFLCEFYTRQRGLVPPARVVLLDELDASLQPGAFDLALNVHSFSECPEAAVRWWLEQLTRLRIPRLFVVPNEADGLLSTEPDGSQRDLLPLIATAGYRLTQNEKAIADPAVRELLRIEDQFLLFERSG